MVVHKIRYEGKTYVGRSQRDGTVVFDPPLPERYVQDCEGKMADVLEARSFPGLNTDTTFLANRGTLEKQFDGDNEALERVMAKSVKMGYKPNPNSVYMSSLAAYEGDPRAYLTAGDAKGHIRKICEERGVGCSGSVNIPQPEPKVDPDEARRRARERALARLAKRQKAVQSNG